MRLGAALALLILSACASTPRMGVYVDPTGQVHPSVATTLGGVRLGTNGRGGHLGAAVGPIDLGVGF